MYNNQFNLAPQLSEEKKITAKPVKKKARGIVDLALMKKELQQLEDPPVTAVEKALTANRLTYEFYNKPAEELAQNLLGKIK